MIITLLLTLVSAQEEKQRFGIKYPDELASIKGMNNITFNIANFGFVPYGQRISGVVQLGFPLDFCKIPNWGSETNSTSSQPSTTEPIYDAQIVIVMRGACTFYTKAFNAQAQGYQMLIIVDDKEEKVDGLNLVSLNNTEEIDIPAIMIGKQDGEAIINYLKLPSSKTVRAYIRFPDVMKTKTVDYQYWFSAMDASSYQFLEQFYPFQLEMKDSLTFTPHYAMIRCGYCASNKYTQKTEQCLSGGRYCAPDPDGDGPETGQGAVLEIVRQLCIFKDKPTKWWKYAVKYGQQCLGIENTTECRNSAMKQADLSVSDVEECIKKSFLGNDIYLNDNKLLQEEYAKNEESQVMSWPVLTINSLKYKGSLTVSTYTYNYDTGAQELLDTNHFGPLQAICRSFDDKSIPSICQKRMIGYIDDGRWVEHENSSSMWLIWVVVISTMILLMICTTYMYKRMFRKETNERINQEVNIHLAQYYTLNEQEKSMRK